MGKNRCRLVTLGKSGAMHNIKRPKKAMIKTKKSVMKSVGKQIEKVQALNSHQQKIDPPSSEVRNVLSNLQIKQHNKRLEEKNDPEMQGLSEYEKIRLRNIREREDLFSKLQIQEAKSLVSLPRKVAQRKDIQDKKEKKNLSKENKACARKSLRISNGGLKPIDRSYAAMTRPITRPPRREEGLTPVEKSRFNVLQVSKNCTIKEFVLENKLAFKCGRGFYEFTKPEIISYKKEVVIVAKASGEMFTGQEACDMIGAGSGIRTPPTSFVKWRVFVQSTSVGRKLVAGTGFLYQTH